MKFSNKFILGTKVNMTQIFDEAGLVHPVTVLKAGPLTVTAIKTVATDGYNAVQVGFGERKEKNLSKAVKGHLKGKSFMYIKEFRTEGEPTFKVGDVIDLSTFASGDVVTITGTSKAKGFQGVVKRHGFKGGSRTHGQKHSEREPGSIGGGGRDGGRVAKNKKMAGRMGGTTITSKGLTIVSVKPETGELFVRGAVPGRRGSLVEVNG